MPQTRQRRDGSKTVANTIYIHEECDKKADRIAKEKNRSEKLLKNKWTKSKVLVDVVEKHL